jgi:phosphatidylinositol kinase/protein kinase (PI-3  family)
MQQVFDNVNFTLLKDIETRKRNLSIRTYKIIPLTSQTGVIQWVNNTIPFGGILTDRDRMSGAHSRYSPQDWT